MLPVVPVVAMWRGGTLGTSDLFQSGPHASPPWERPWVLPCGSSRYANSDGKVERTHDV